MNSLPRRIVKVNKNEFLSQLRKKLSSLSKEDIEKSADYYSEMIEDHMEDGMTEEDAVLAVGSVDDAVAQILTDTPLSKLVKQKVIPKQKMSTLKKILLFAGSPIWAPLLLCGIILAFSIYAVIWAAVIVLYAAVIALFVAAILAIVEAVSQLSPRVIYYGLTLFGGSYIAIGIGILLFFCANLAAKGTVLLGKKMISTLKISLIRKGHQNENL